jgi:protein O-GlcNAc transferase
VTRHADDGVATALEYLRTGDVDHAMTILRSPGRPAQPGSGGALGRHAALGMAHLAQGDWPAARAALRIAVSLGDRLPETLLNLALAEDRAGDSRRGQALMTQLCQRLLTWDEPALRLAESLRRNGQAAAAAAAYQDALDRSPQRADTLIGFAALLMERCGSRDGDARDYPARAQMMLLQCCAAAPSRADAWHALGIALMLTDEPGKAEAAFARAQSLAPNDVAIAIGRAGASIAADSAAGELARLELALTEDPLNVALLVARGGLLGQQRRHDEAIEVLEVAMALAPEAVVPAVAMAHALTAANRIREALPALQHAMVLASDDTGLRNNYAATLIRMHRYNDATCVLEALIAEQGEQPGTLCNLTNALVSVGRQDAALRMAERAVALDPASHVAWRTMANVLAYCPQVSGDALLSVNRRAGAAIARTVQPPPANVADPGRRLRVGLLSAVLKKHPVGWLTVAGFENLDPHGFDLVCLGQPGSADPLQRRFAAAASAWYVVEGQSVAAMTAQIRAAEIDILIDLSGYGDRGLMHLCAERLVPVQVKWVGAQCHSSGLAEMDWFITDRWETPAGFERFYSERLLHMPNGYVCYAPPAYAPEVAGLPALRRGAFTFGCFNNLAKITPSVVATWCEILQAVPGSRMVVKSHPLSDAATADAMRAAFAAHGIGPDRLDLRGGSPHRDLLGEYRDIDIVLDPFPYSGGLTTCEALWMGVPTITMPGETFASRHSASHMSNVGLADWVAPDLTTYRDMAVRRAGEPAALAALRAGLRAQVQASPLCDGPRFGADLGRALRHAWHAWCDRPVQLRS